MNKPTPKFLFLGALVLVIVFLLGRCSSDRVATHDSHAVSKTTSAAPGGATKAGFWTCSMHPQIRQPGPGKCPICAMDLIPIESGDSGADHSPRTLVMSESALALADIQTTIIERRFPKATVRLVGQLDYDETRVRSLTARYPARIDRLFVNYTGGTVTKGAHLARIYSPELIGAQRELLTSHAADPDGPVTAAARDKLLLWDILPEQIDAIIALGDVADFFEMRAPAEGVVVAKNINEGNYVNTGEPLFRIADLGELWLHLQAFESDLAKLRYGQEVTFTVEAWPGETFTGRIAFIASAVNQDTRTVPVRVNVPNPDGRLKPGMFARGQVSVLLAGNNQVFNPNLAGKWISPMHPEIVKDGPGVCDVCGMALVPAATLGYTTPATGEAPLVAPASALLRTGKRAVVYVRLTDTDQPAFEGREVVLGSEADGSVIIVSGLTEGDEVVTHGAFKIDSALQILAKPSMMNPTGGGSAPGHDHGGAPSSKPSATPTDHSGHAALPTPALVLETARARSLLPAYFKLQTALADDDLAAAKDALRAMMEVSGHDGALPDLLHHLLGADQLDILRRPAFDQLSSAMIAALKKEPAALKGTVFQMHCPMVYDDRGADWLQATDEVRNPYFGSAMLTCGETLQRLK
ncbi:MAG TPA: efflux RND transporter periplasmic adaptor subunit [Opitutaceae bacterium]|nr:efflux RND transporter periplasmic adaptor subunit [Opitutaceae bacterium]